MRQTLRKALQLCLFALVSYVLFYGIGVFLARTLGVAGYKSYSVAIATLTLAASLATLGLEKYAVRVLPVLCAGRDWSRAHGFLFFGQNVVLLTSLLLVLAYVAVSAGGALVAGNEPQWPSLLAVLILPLMAGGLFMLEILVANGEAVRSTMIYRFVRPICVVLPLLAIWLSPIELTVLLAVAIYGLSWMVSFLLFRWMALRSMPKEVMTAARVLEPRLWLQRSAPFFIHSVMMTQFASLGIVGLELLGSGEHDVAVLAATMQTGGFVVMLATATNRLYGPTTSLLIEQRDYSGMIAAIRERHAWIIPATLVYIVTMVIFGRSILRLFGPEFTEGFAALCWIVAGASVSVWFAMAPNYLKFVEMNRPVLGITAAAGGLNVVLLVVLGSRFGATGAGAAYGISLAAMSITFFVLARRAARRILRT